MRLKIKRWMQQMYEEGESVDTYFPPFHKFRRLTRRGRELRAKRRAERIIRRWFDDHPEWVTARLIGINAGVHCKACSCVMCGNKRRLEGKTRQERIADEDSMKELEMIFADRELFRTKLEEWKKTEPTLASRLEEWKRKETRNEEILQGGG
jgi:hypothetical protein